MLCAISCSTDLESRYTRDFLNTNYMFYFKSLVPSIDLLVISNIFDFEMYLDRVGVNGIILSGGDNIGKCSLRDTQEKKLLDYAIKKELPVLGICRGIQFINNYFGGTTRPVANHAGISHNINIISSSWSHGVGMLDLKVNSFHEYNITKRGMQLDIACIADDGVVEAVQHRIFPIAGIQWHPERNGNDKNDIVLKLLRNLM